MIASDASAPRTDVSSAHATTTGSAATPGPIGRRIEEARRRLDRRLHPVTPQYHRPPERPFTAAERDEVTILIGGLSWKHERLIEALLRACGHRCQRLPTPDLAACLVGKQYGNNALCNPAYFTVGNLVAWLQQQEARGMSRQAIVDRYVYFTAGGCGPCRFGMYEAEFRVALRNAGFEGFRVLTFRQDHGVKARTGEAGLNFSLLLGFGALNAFQLADVVNDFAYSVRPYELEPGATNRTVAEVMDLLASNLAARREEPFENLGNRPLRALLSVHPQVRRFGRHLLNMRRQWYGEPMREALDAMRERCSHIEVDRLRVKPVVKVTGEFWAQSTEGDGNYRMFEFLEREGAHVLADPLSAWVMYLLHQAFLQATARRGVDIPRTGPRLPRLAARVGDELRYQGKRLAFGAAHQVYRRRYDHVRRALDDVPHALVDQRELARLASPFYNPLARGGEGHLEVAKNIYYSTRPDAHMVLSLKPFGCMPSTQSDGVQSSVVARYRDMIYLPIETAPDGELNAHSRVQMALVEARERAQEEFDRVLASTGKTLSDLRAYVAAHPVLRHPYHPVPHRHGVVGIAARFALHVSDLMDHDRAWHRHDVRHPSPLSASAPEETR